MISWLITELFELSLYFLDFIRVYRLLIANLFNFICFLVFSFRIGSNVQIELRLFKNLPIKLNYMRYRRNIVRFFFLLRRIIGIDY